MPYIYIYIQKYNTYIYIYLFIFLSGSFQHERVQLDSCQHRADVAGGRGGAASPLEFLRELDLFVLKARSGMALKALDHIARAVHVVRRVPEPEAACQRSMMANFPNEAGENLLSCPCQHVASAAGAAEIRFLQAQVMSARRHLTLALQKIMDDLKAGLLWSRLGSCLWAWHSEAIT